MTDLGTGRRRRAWIAAAASLFFAPLGHVYAGRARRGIAAEAGRWERMGRTVR